MKSRTGWTIMLALAVLSAVAVSHMKDQSPMSEADQLQALLDRLVQERSDVSGALAIVESEHGTLSAAAGVADRGTGKAMQPNDRFRAGSILKTMIAVVTLQLVEEGLISLDEVLTDCLPDSVTRGFSESNRTTVRNLLNHTSGAPNWVSEETDARVLAEPGKIWTDREILALAQEKPTTFEPGEGWAYSNTGYNLLGIIIEQATGESWRAEVRRRVIDRLGLANTALPEPGNTSISDSEAHGYQAVDGNLVDLTTMDPSMAGASGGHALRTNAHDLIRFIKAVFAGDMFQNAQTLEEMTTFVDAPDENGIPYEYGLALEKYTLPGAIDIIGHSGTTGGFAAAMVTVPELELTIVSMINTQDLEPVYVDIIVPLVEAIRTSQGS